jgi:hypothetical protein
MSAAEQKYLWIVREEVQLATTKSASFRFGPESYSFATAKQTETHIS